MPVARHTCRQVVAVATIAFLFASCSIHQPKSSGGARAQATTVLATGDSRGIVLQAVAELATAQPHATVDEYNRQLREQIIPRLLSDRGKGRRAALTIVDTDLGITNDPTIATAIDQILTTATADAQLPRADRLRRLFADIIIDHHGPYFDASHAERNATHQLIEKLRPLIATASSPDDATQQIAIRFSFVSTDNLGDGAQSLWLIKNAHRLAADPHMLDVFAKLAWLEDFGIFGSKFLDRWQAQEFTDAQYGDLVELEFAILHGYDHVLHQHNVRNSDRFYALSGPEQITLLDAALAHLTAVLDDHTLRRTHAQAFVAAATNSMPAILSGRIRTIDPPQAEQLRDRGIRWPQAILDRMFVFTGPPPTPGDGVFSSWMAKSIVHDANVQLELTTLPDPVCGARTMFILAVPNGRSVNIDFRDTIAVLNDANVKAVGQRNLGTDFRTGRAFGRATLVVSFPPDAVILDTDTLLTEVIASIADPQRIDTATATEATTHAGDRTGPVADLIHARAAILASQQP